MINPAYYAFIFVIVMFTFIAALLLYHDHLLYKKRHKELLKDGA